MLIRTSIRKILRIADLECPNWNTLLVDFYENFSNVTIWLLWMSTVSNSNWSSAPSGSIFLCLKCWGERGWLTQICHKLFQKWNEVCDTKNKLDRAYWIKVTIGLLQAWFKKFLVGFFCDSLTLCPPAQSSLCHH